MTTTSQSSSYHWIPRPILNSQFPAAWQYELLKSQTLREVNLNTGLPPLGCLKPTIIPPPCFIPKNWPQQPKSELPRNPNQDPYHKNSQVLVPLEKIIQDKFEQYPANGTLQSDEDIFVASVVPPQVQQIVKPLGMPPCAQVNFKLARSFRLPISKSPVIESMVFCALNKWFIHLKENDLFRQRIVFKVLDFHKYFHVSSAICSKHTPSDDIRSRMKALQRWFLSFPSKQDLNMPFELVVKAKQWSKVKDIIKRMSAIQIEPPDVLPLLVRRNITSVSL